MNNYKYIVYMHINKTNDKKYIGITRKTPNERWNNGYGYIRNPHFFNAIKKYGWDNFDHIIMYRNLCEEVAIEIERDLIEKFDTTNQDKGYNLSPGGRGPGMMTEETRKKISESHKGIRPSEETRKKLSLSKSGENNPHYGKHWTEEERAKHIEFWKNYKMPQETRERIDNILIDLRGFIVFQYTLDGKYIQKFRSAGEAARIVGISSASIKACCGGRYTKAGNYLWRYEKDGFTEGLDIEYVPPQNSKYSPVIQYDDDGNIINTFSKIADASKALNIDRHRITKCCQGLIKKAGGYIWKYA